MAPEVPLLELSMKAMSIEKSQERQQPILEKSKHAMYIKLAATRSLPREISLCLATADEEGMEASLR